MEGLYEYLISFTLAFIVAFASTPAVRRLAFFAGAVDVPKDERRMHKRPIPRFGGLAIVSAFFVAIGFNMASVWLGISEILPIDIKLVGLLAGAAIIIGSGVMDDMWDLGAKRIIFQLIAAIIVVGTGTRIEFVTNPFSEVVMVQLPTAASYILTIVWIVGITNAINWIDGLDGLAAGVASIASLTLFFVSVTRTETDMVTALIAAILAGSILGFLPYNFNPAKIFMADTGAPFLGFVLAVLSVQGTYKAYTAVSVAVPLLALAIPLFDTLFAILRRAATGKSIVQADRGHIHHRLVDMGLSQKQSVALIYVASASLGLCAVVLGYQGPLSALVLAVGVSIFVIAGALFMNELNQVSAKYLSSKEKAPEKIGDLEYKQFGRLNCEKQGKIKVMTVFGTRPEAVKMAPLVLELDKHKCIESIVCVTAQHRQMLDQVLDVFNIEPDHDLNIMQNRQTLTDITTRGLEGLGKTLDEVKPDIVLVHGDTTTTFISSLAAFYKQIRVGHVEAGLRTNDKYFPYPEEMNRKLTGSLTDIHFSPTVQNKENLLKENINGKHIYVTGNTVIDALSTTVDKTYEFNEEKLTGLDFVGKRVIAVTAHRRENLGQPLENICNALKRIADKFSDVLIVYPVHLNPAVQEVADRILGLHDRIALVDPLDLQDMHNLMDRSYFVMTDSGGLQEEAPSMGKPVLVLRNETERPEAVKSGTVKIAGTDEEKIFTMACELLEKPEEYAKMAKAVNPYGDGKACQRIVQALLFEFGLSEERPQEFVV